MAESQLSLLKPTMCSLLTPAGTKGLSCPIL